jgi:predicted dehydrogenase
MNTVRLGVAGCGVIGQKHLEAAVGSPLIKVTAVADLREETAARTAEKFGVPKYFKTGADLVRSPDVDAVVLAMPTLGRTELALEALRAGKHTLVEKPGGMSASEVDAMIAARGGLTAACCSSRFRHNKSAGIAAGYIVSGELGKLRSIHCRAFSPAGPKPSAPPPLWRLDRSNGGGILMNWGVYDLDFIFGLTGWRLKPQKVIAKTWSAARALRSTHLPPGSDAETHYTALIICDGGAAVSLERAEYAAAKAEGRWHFVGEDGALDLMMTGRTSITTDKLSPDKGVERSSLWEGEDDVNAGILSGPVLDFASAIVSGSAPMTTLENYLTIQKVTDAVYASAETGKTIDIH